MPDLYAINLHLQQRLELDWREEVRAVEAARWLDKADLLRNHKNGLPLRRLLRAGRTCQRRSKISPPGRSKTSPLNSPLTKSVVADSI